MVTIKRGDALTFVDKQRRPRAKRARPSEVDRTPIPESEKLTDKAEEIEEFEDLEDWTDEPEKEEPIWEPEPEPPKRLADTRRGRHKPIEYEQDETDKREEPEQKKIKKEKLKREKPKKKKQQKEKKPLFPALQRLTFLQRSSDGAEKYTETDFVVKKHTGMKIGRVVLWIALIFFVFRGVASAFKPNSAAEANQLITEFRAGFDDYREVETEILAFAQNFARQYMTYEVKGEKDYKQRLAQYVASEVLDMNFSFGSSAKVIYAEAYRREEYSDNQSDVYVLLDVEYPEGQENQENTESHTVIIKVPVFAVGKKYIVEDLPCFVSDELKVESYASQPHSGTEVTPQEREDIRQSLTNFFQSYYESGTDVINYYLSKEADRSKFLGLDKRLLFGGIDSVKSYSHPDGLVRSIVTVNVIDVNGVKMPQRYNLILEKMDGKYYIRSMDARSVNVKKEVVSHEKAEEDV